MCRDPNDPYARYEPLTEQQILEINLHAAEEKGDYPRLTEESGKFGVPQEIVGDKSKVVGRRVREMIVYMNSIIIDSQLEDPEYADQILSDCRNEEDLCCFWAVEGECEANEGYMTQSCGPCCKTCDLYDEP